MEENSRFGKVDARQSFTEMEKEIISFWNEEEIFRKVREKMDGKKKFIFLEGPPTANGMPHIGHALTRSVKDAFLRYRFLTGHTIKPYIAGWDCHGLPVELEVEKELGMESKEEIIEYGVEKFNARCKKSVFKYRDAWAEMDERVGLWMDFDNAYVTMTDPYIESVWWSLKQLWEKKLLEKGYYVVPYCPRCGTPLSSHEVAQGYETTEDPTVIVKFHLEDEEASLLAWTTTPWTLISNLLLAVGQEMDYSLVQFRGERYYLATEAVDRTFSENMSEVELLKVVKGKELVGKQYKQLLPFVDAPEPSLFITSAPFVTAEEGTGVVHIAPAYGIDDYEICREKGVGMVNPVDDKGRFTEEVTPWAGVFVKDADPSIMEYLESYNLLFDTGKIRHTYPFCWRCDSPLLYYALDSWFVRMARQKTAMMENNEKVNWKPEHLKHGRFGNFLKELKDWALSRNRFWGTPLPVWVCTEDESHQTCIGSKEELAEKATEPLPEDFELHRPWVDYVVLKCPECGSDMHREEYVIDTWYDSGSATFAQFHYPFENKDEFDAAFPVDFITEAIDQTRGWFYTLLAVSTSVFGKEAYENVLTLGLILDEDGQKMSKSKGNAVNPISAMDKVGADTVRLHLYSVPVWASTRFSPDLALETQKKTLGTLWNVYFFFVSNANLDGFVPSGEVKSDNILDRWLLSRLDSLTEAFHSGFNEYELHLIFRELVDFINDFSNWYLRRSRKRFWVGELTEEKREAYETVHHALVTLAKLMAPMTPFFSESVYRNLSWGIDKTAPESVHLTTYPEVEPALRDEELEKGMKLAIKIAEAGRHARQKENIKLRQPLAKMMLAGEKESLDRLDDYLDILADEINVKEIVRFEDEKELMDPVVKLDHAKAGPKYKADAPAVKKELEAMDPRNALKKLAEGNLKAGGHLLDEEDVDVSWVEKPDYSATESEGIWVAVDTLVTPELKKEGLSREIIRRIQSMRKDLDLGYDQRIDTYVKGDEEISEVLSTWGEHIASETLSDGIQEGTVAEGESKTWEIEDAKVEITIIPK